MGQGIFLPVAGQTREVSSVTMGYGGNRNVTGGWIGVALTPRQFWGGRYARYFNNGYNSSVYNLYYKLAFLSLVHSASSAYPSSKTLYDVLSTEFTNYCYDGYAFKDSKTWDTTIASSNLTLHRTDDADDTSEGFFLIPILLTNVRKIRFTFSEAYSPATVKIGFVTIRNSEFLIHSITKRLENNKVEVSFSGDNRADYIIYEGREIPAESSQQLPVLGYVPPITGIYLDYEKDYFPIPGEIVPVIGGYYTGGVNNPCLHLTKRDYGQVSDITMFPTGASSPVFMFINSNNSADTEHYLTLNKTRYYTVYFISRKPFDIVSYNNTGFAGDVLTSQKVTYDKSTSPIPGSQGTYYRVWFGLDPDKETGAADGYFLTSQTAARNKCYINKAFDDRYMGWIISGTENTDVYTVYHHWENYGAN